MEKLQILLKSFWIETQGDKKLYKVVYGEKGFEFWYQPYVGAKLEKTWRLQDEILFSKSFGFIKWLVDNDKIDRDKIIEKSDFMPIVSDKFGDFLQPTEEQELLMLLAIQENPIEFLCSVLI